MIVIRRDLFHVRLDEGQIENIPEEYRGLVSSDMGIDDLSRLGSVLIRGKLSRFKNKLSLGVYKLRQRLKFK